MCFLHNNLTVFIFTIRRTTELRHNQIHHIGIDQVFGEFLAQLTLNRPGHDAPVNRVIAQCWRGGQPQTWWPTESQPHSIRRRRRQIDTASSHQTFELHSQLNGGAHVLHGLLDVGDFGGRLEEIGSRYAIDNAQEFLAATAASGLPKRFKKSLCKL